MLTVECWNRLEIKTPTRFEKPDDGLPVITDFLQTAESMLFSGIDLGREPIDCSVPSQGVSFLKQCQTQPKDFVLGLTHRILYNRPYFLPFGTSLTLIFSNLHVVPLQLLRGLATPAPWTLSRAGHALQQWH